MTVDFVATDWGTVGPAAPQDAAGAGRLEHVPHLARRCRLREPGVLHALRANGEKAWFGWPDVPDGREGGHGLVRRQGPGRGEGRDRTPQQGGDGATSSMCRPASIYGYQAWRSNVGGRRQGPAAVPLGRDEGVQHGSPRGSPMSSGLSPGSSCRLLERSDAIRDKPGCRLISGWRTSTISRQIRMLATSSGASWRRSQ